MPTVTHKHKFSHYSFPGINFSDPQKEMSLISEIKKIVCKNYGHSFEEIDVKVRTRALCEVRQAIMWWLQELTTLGLADIGKEFTQNFDHSTVIHGIRVYETIYQTNRSLNKAHKQTQIDIDRLIK